MSGDTGTVADDGADPRDLLRLFADADALRTRGLFAAEGRFVVERVVSAGGYVPLVVAVTPPARVAMADVLALLPPPVVVLELLPRELQQLVGYPLDRGCVAIVRRPAPRSIDALLDGGGEGPTRWVVLENVSNPDNVGSLFRAAAAFGVSGVLLVGGCADPLYRKTVRTSLGNTLTVPFARAADAGDAFTVFERHVVSSAALVACGGEALHGWPAGDDRLALWLGHEGDGLDARTIARCTHRVTIAMPGAIDSLNVAVAGAIVLHHVATR